MPIACLPEKPSLTGFPHEMMKWLVDVNTSRAAGALLVSMGHDVAYVADCDPRMTDDEILSWAVREQRVLITTDQDFEEMIWKQSRPHNGLLRLENVPRAERHALLLYVLNCHADDLNAGAIIIAMTKKIRIRKR